jgi:dTDP-4-dehydrorhamnose 3,5-epimerase
MLDARQLPLGVRLLPMELHGDGRGALVEVWRKTPDPATERAQWTITWNNAGALRGVHVHRFREDYLVAVGGEVFIGLRDVRRSSSTAGLNAEVVLRAEQPQTLVIPVGVAHGVCSVAAASFLLGMSVPWDAEDDHGCHWADPELGINWPLSCPKLSPRDRDLPPLRNLQERVSTWWSD